jgi:hypothetical protein
MQSESRRLLLRGAQSTSFLGVLHEVVRNDDRLHDQRSRGCRQGRRLKLEKWGFTAGWKFGVKSTEVLAGR